MRVLILSVSDKRHMPMVSMYIDYLSKNSVAFDIIRSNRYVERKERVYKEKHKFGYVYEIGMVQNISTSRIKKIIPFFIFRREANKIIKQNKYDYIIVWNENTAALFSLELRTKYNQKYCINIRDIYQHIPIIKTLVKNALRGSHFVTVPSPECPTDFPEKTICVFNKDTTLLSKWKKRTELREKNLPIRITHLGFYSKVKRAADDMAHLFGNDSRFELFFYGSGFDTEYQQMLNDKGIKNIHTGGAFKPEDTIKFLQEADIINSYYNMFSQPSLSISFGIKHSYTPMLYLPGLADENTCWGRMSKPYNLAYLVNDSNVSTLPNDLYNWYRNLDFDIFCRKCDEFNEIIDSSLTELHTKLDSIIIG